MLVEEILENNRSLSLNLLRRCIKDGINLFIKL
jgi:hypothetical protein